MRSTQQQSWLKRQTTYQRWIRSLRAGRDRTKLPIAEQFLALVREVEVRDRWGIVTTHLIPRTPRQRIRLHGRRVGLQTAAWMIQHGPVDVRYAAVAACELPNCCAHLTLRLTGGKHAKQH